MAAHLSAEPARRVRDAEYAAELLGLRLDVPWSIWDGYEAGVREPGILWRYDAEERTFTVRFAQQNWPQEFWLGGIPKLIVKTPNTKRFRRTA